jgi:hypothetical protein
MRQSISASSHSVLDRHSLAKVIPCDTNANIHHHKHGISVRSPLVAVPPRTLTIASSWATLPNHAFHRGGNFFDERNAIEKLESASPIPAQETLPFLLDPLKERSPK